MATQPSSFQSISDVDRELATMGNTLGVLVQGVAALQEAAAERRQLVDMAVVMTETHEYSEHTRREADLYAERIRAQADVEAAAQRQATAEACQAAESSSRVAVGQLYAEAQEALATLQTDYAVRRTAISQVQKETRGAWTDYKTRMATAYETVDQALSDPPPTLPALETLATLAAPFPGSRSAALSAEVRATRPAAPDPVIMADVSAAMTQAAPTPPAGDLGLPPDETPTLAETPPRLIPNPLNTAPWLPEGPRGDPPRGDASAAPVRPVATVPARTPPAADSTEDLTLPTLGSLPARPLLVRDQTLPTFVEPARGR